MTGSNATNDATAMPGRILLAIAVWMGAASLGCAPISCESGLAEDQGQTQEQLLRSRSEVGQSEDEWATGEEQPTTRPTGEAPQPGAAAWDERPAADAPVARRGKPVDRRIEARGWTRVRGLEPLSDLKIRGVPPAVLRPDGNQAVTGPAPRLQH